MVDSGFDMEKHPCERPTLAHSNDVDARANRGDRGIVRTEEETKLAGGRGRRRTAREQRRQRLRATSDDFRGDDPDEPPTSRQRLGCDAGSRSYRELTMGQRASAVGVRTHTSIWICARSRTRATGGVGGVACIEHGPRWRCQQQAVRVCSVPAGGRVVIPDDRQER